MDRMALNFTAFVGTTCVASGDLRHVVRKSKEMIDSGENAQVLIFDDTTSDIIEVDFRGTVDDVLWRIAGSTGGVAQTVEPESRGPGRPKLGVIAREVTLLPRHWAWLAS